MLRTDYSNFYFVRGGVINRMAEAINDLAMNGGGGGGAVASVNGKIGAVVLELKDLLSPEDGGIANSAIMLVNTADPNDATQTTYLGPQQIFITEAVGAGLSAILKATGLSVSGGSFRTVLANTGLVVSDINSAGMVSRITNTGIGWGWADDTNGATITPDTNVSGYVDLVLPSKNGTLALTSDIVVPAPPATGTWELRSVDGVVSWVEQPA